MVGWLDVAKFEETGDEAKAQGWTPIIIDTNGNGKRDAYVGPNDPVDPTKDKRINAAFYGVQPSPADDSIWGQSMDVGFTRVDQPGYILRFVPGAEPAEHRADRDLHVAGRRPGARAASTSTSEGVVWTPLASGHIASFDRRKCKGPLNGPQAATGKLCPEGWTLYRMPGPQFKGVDEKGSANHAYYLWVDRFNTLGLGNDVPIAQANGARVAAGGGRRQAGRHPRAVPARLLHQERRWPHRRSERAAGRARDCGPRRARAPSSTTKAARQNRPQVYKVQVRPDPLAR